MKVKLNKLAGWQSGHAADCKSVYAGSIPASASKQIIDIEQAEIRKAIFNLIESQLQIQMLSNVKNDYILTAIDKPYVPENKSSPDRAFILIMGAFFGLAISCISALLRKKKAQIA